MAYPTTKTQAIEQVHKIIRTLDPANQMSLTISKELCKNLIKDFGITKQDLGETAR